MCQALWERLDIQQWIMWGSNSNNSSGLEDSQVFQVPRFQIRTKKKCTQWNSPNVLLQFRVNFNCDMGQKIYNIRHHITSVPYKELYWDSTMHCSHQHTQRVNVQQWTKVQHWRELLPDQSIYTRMKIAFRDRQIPVWYHQKTHTHKTEDAWTSSQLHLWTVNTSCQAN